MQTQRRFAAIAGFSIFLFSLPSHTLAQQSPAQQPSLQQPPPVQQTDVKDTELRSFAKVYVQIEKIRETYDPQLKQAKTPEEGKQIQTEAVSKMEQALTQEGMDKQTYNRIFETARADDGVRKKLFGFINEERQKS